MVALKHASINIGPNYYTYFVFVWPCQMNPHYWLSELLHINNESTKQLPFFHHQILDHLEAVAAAAASAPNPFTISLNALHKPLFGTNLAFPHHLHLLYSMYVVEVVVWCPAESKTQPPHLLALLFLYKPMTRRRWCLCYHIGSKGKKKCKYF